MIRLITRMKALPEKRTELSRTIALLSGSTYTTRSRFAAPNLTAGNVCTIASEKLRMDADVLTGAEKQTESMIRNSYPP